MRPQPGFTDKLRKVRRQLHSNAETRFDLDATKAYLTQVFGEEGISLAEAGRGLIADIGNGAPRVLLRADMDALPLRDGKQVVYASKNEGACHACGHDGHMAMLYGAALLLKERHVKNSIRLIFQPCEECPPGGALGMIEAGVLEGIQAAFAIHLDPSLQFGRVGVKPGVLMAATDGFTLTIKGKGGHGAQPHKAVDAILAASHVVTTLQALVSRMNDPLEPLVLTVGKVCGGTASNVIADTVVLEGTVRTLSADLRSAMPEQIKYVAGGVCAAFGASCELNYLLGYPPLENNSKMTELVAREAAAVIGEQNVVNLERPVMGGEDFAYILQRVPGCFFRLGIGDEEFNHPLHHPCFDFNEEILAVGAELLAAIASAV
ncbi:MAG: amidohydrolase [Dethiobacter sp.]|nr:amidohydrolase [Dethiobacter sp.]